MPIPWEKIILHGPQVLDAAKNLYGNWQTRSRQTKHDPATNEEFQPQLDSLFVRVQVLEDAGEKQAALARDLAEQNQALSIALRSLDAQAEEMKNKIDDSAHAQTRFDSRLTELSDQLRQANAAVSEVNRKIVTLIFVSVSALTVSIIALLMSFSN